MLLEVIVALAILGVAGAAAVTMSAESARAVARARATDSETRAASALLDAVALWSRDDLDRHIGDRRQGPWRMRVERPLTTVYLVTLADSSGAATILQTALFRADTANVAP